MAVVHASSFEATLEATNTEAGRLIAAFRWGATALGPIETWPQPLKTLVGVMLAADQPMFVAWGREGTMLYNDGYSTLLADRHPAALGRSFLAVWSEARGELAPLVDRVFNGEPIHMRDIELHLDRPGRPREAHFAFSYTPVRDEKGAVAGLFCPCVETTEQVLAERQRAATEAALRAERDRAQGVLDNMGEAFALLDRDLRILDMNAEGLRLEARPREAVVGQTHEAAHPQADPGLARLYRQALAENRAVTLEHRHAWPDDRTRWLEMRAYPVETGLAVFYRDVTERRDAEEALREREERLRLVVEGAADYAILTVGTDNRVSSWSAGAEAAFGYAAHEIVGEPVDVLFTPEDRAENRPEREIELARRDGSAPDVRWHRRKDGSRVFVNGTVRPLRDGENREIGFLKIARDETERRQAEDAARETAERYRLAVRATNDAIWDWEFATNHVLWNEALQTAYGHQLREVEPTGEWWIEHIHPDDRARVSDGIHAAIDGTAESWTDEYRFRRANGLYADVLDRGHVIRDADGRATRMIGAMLDLSERKAVERRLRFLGDLDESLRASRDAPAAMLGAAEVLARRLNASRCAYADVDADNDRFVIRSDYTAPNVASSAGTYSLDLFGPRAAADMRGGRMLVVRNVSAELAPGEGLEMFHAIGIEAIVCCPLVQGGRLVAMMAVHQDRPRDWQQDEIALVEATVERCWAHVERVGAQARLRESEERLRLATEAAEVGFWDVDMVRDVLIWPPRVKAMFGISADVPVTMQDFHAGLHPDDRQATADAFAAAADPARRALYDVEYRTVGREDRCVRWVAAKGRGVFDAGGRCVRVVGTAIDVTTRKRIEERLRELNDTLESQVAARSAARARLWNLSQDMLARADYSGMMSAVSPAWTQVLGWSEHELLSRGYASFMHPNDGPSTLEAIGRMAETRQPTRFENRIATRDDGWKHIDWTVAPEPDGAHFIAVGRDVTAEKERQTELAEAQEALRQAQKMEAVGQLTGGIAHDFNNLLTGVIGSLDMMQRRIAKGETDRIERYATAAMTSANRAASLTHRLLAFSRRQPLDPKPTNANRLVTGMEELLRRTIGEAVKLEIVTAGGLWQTRCDPHQLESAILNLAINARDAMPGGGKLTIETGNAHLDNAYAAKSRDVKPGQYVCICVTDTGTGMSPDVIAKAFDPFFTTKPIGQGTGLGLSMIYGFARQSEGYAKLYSEVGRGTAVKIYLPRYHGEADNEDEAGPSLADAPRAEHGEVVLVVEDETAVRGLVVDVLQELGYRAVEASDGPSGLKLLQSDMRVDLLVTDVGLPGLNGRQLADAAREHRPDLKVLFMTGYAENAAIANGFLDPGMQMITKPFAIEALTTRIRDMIEAKG